MSQGNVTVRVGDLFKSNAQTLVNTVNCVGVMGKGVALQFKQRYPDMYADYVNRCSRGEVRLGRPYLYRRDTEAWVINFPTKDHWRSVARLSDIVEGLKHLERNHREWGITSLAVPPLGCGEGQLEWTVVGPTLHRYLSRLSVPVELFAPFGTPHEELQPSFFNRPLQALNGDSVFSDGLDRTDEPRVSAGQVALVAILAEIQSSRYRRPIGRTAFQKIAYFATRCGIPTGLSYERGSYGPHADGLKRLVTVLSNNGLLEEERRGRMFALSVGPTFRDAQRAYSDQLAAWRPMTDKIADLFVRISQAKDAEVAATVHYAADELSADTAAKPAELDVLDAVLSWKMRRRPPLEPEKVAESIRMLAALNWIDVSASSDLPINETEILGV